VFGVILLICIPLLPESPRWLLNHGKPGEAREVIQRLAGKDVGLHDPLVETTMQGIISAIQLEEVDGQFRYAELFHGGSLQNWRRIMLCFLVLGFQQLSGVCL
jgi:hypothetical protein